MVGSITNPDIHYVSTPDGNTTHYALDLTLDATWLTDADRGKSYEVTVVVTCILSGNTADNTMSKKIRTITMDTKTLGYAVAEEAELSNGTSEITNTDSFGDDTELNTLSISDSFDVTNADAYDTLEADTVCKVIMEEVTE